MSDHQPVLMKEVVGQIPVDAQRVVDATTGLGGHAKELLNKARQAELLGLDQDEESLKKAQQNLLPAKTRVNLIVANFSEIDQAAKDIGWDWADFILFDLGTSSWQLENPSYGLSFRHEAPLDMRLNKSVEVTAAKVVNMLDEKDLTRIFRELGEEPFAQRVARAIINERATTPIEQTTHLAAIVTNAIPAKARFSRKVHPATNVFRALRMYVNDELENLSQALPQATKLLKVDGKLLVITFHSLEDRIVKRFMREEVSLVPQKGKPILPSEQEIAENPRARSAKLRIAVKQQGVSDNG